MFRLVYPWVPNRKGVGINRGLENLKFNSRGGVEEILFDTLEYQEAEGGTRLLGTQE